MRQLIENIQFAWNQAKSVIFCNFTLGENRSLSSRVAYDTFLLISVDKVVFVRMQ